MLATKLFMYFVIRFNIMAKSKKPKAIPEKVQRSKRGKHMEWTETSNQSAIEAVKNGRMFQRAACSTFKVPRSFLQTRLSGQTEAGAKPGRPTTLSKEHEEKLVDYACNRAALGTGFGRQQFLLYAAKVGKKHNISFKKGRPPMRW